MSRQAVTRHWLRARTARLVAVGIAIPLVAEARAQRTMPTAVSALTWTAPESLILVDDWKRSSEARILDGSGWVHLTPHQLLFLAIDRGDSVEVTSSVPGAPVQLGTADGTVFPDAIVWQRPGETQLTIPHWSSSSHVALRCNTPVDVRLQLSARSSSAVDWFLLDAQVAAWARGGSRPTAPPTAEARRLLTALFALRAAIPSEERIGAAPNLISLWLEESARARPLSMPFLTPVGLESASTEPVVVGPGHLTLRGPPTDVHRWQLRARGATRLVIRENGAIARVINWSGRDRSAAGWSPVQSIRTLPRGAETAIELEVIEGAVAVSLTAHAYRQEYREHIGAPRRERGALLRAAQPMLDRWLGRASKPATVPPQSAAHFSALDALVQYERSNRAASRALALEQALVGFGHTEDSAWRALFASRLLELALDDDRMASRPPGRSFAAPAISVRARLTAERVSEERILGDVFEETLAPPQLGRRPTWGDTVEQWARALPDDPLVQRIAHQYWTAFPYRALIPETGTPTAVSQIPLGRRDRCRPAEEGIEAWLIADQDKTAFSLDLGPGLYAVSTLRPLDETVREEGVVHIDDQAITIHSGSGLSSRIALRGGPHRIRRTSTTPRFALEATEGMTLPCESLWRWQRAASIRPHRPVTFALPSRGASSVVRLRLDATAGEHHALVTIGARHYQVSAIAPGSGLLELAVGPTDDSITIDSDEELSISAAMRRELDPRPEPESIPLGALVGAKPHAPPGTDPSLSLELLERLRDLGARLRREEDGSHRRALRQRRAELLIRAGYSALALRDVESLPVADAGTDLFRIEGATASVIPVGQVTTIGPLPLPADLRSLSSRRRAFREQDLVACAADLDPNPLSARDAETLLAAYCAEKSGLAATAATLFERLARAEQHGPLMLHAAMLVADSAVTAEAIPRSLTAARLGAWASVYGTDPSALRARLTHSIDWAVPNALDGSAGVAWLARGLTLAPSNRQQLLTHLVDAPRGALLLEDGQQAELLVNWADAKSLNIGSGCDVSFERGACRLEAWLDAAPIDCVPAEAAPECRIAVPAGKHRLRVAFQGQGTLGWVTAQLGTGSLVPVIAAPWSVLDQGDRVRLPLRGPTVLHLRARGNANAGETIGLAGCGLDSIYRRIELPTEPDPEVSHWPTPLFTRPIGREVERSIPIDFDGGCQLTVTAAQANTLLHVAIARPMALPAARLTPAKLDPTTRASAVATEPIATPELVPAVPRRALSRPPLLMGVRGRFVSESLTALAETDQSSSEGAFQDVFGESSAFASRELIARRWWGTLTAGARLRRGPTTEFARAALDLPPQVGLAGVDLIGTAYSQSFGTARTTTYAITGRVSRIWRLNPDVALLPQAGFSTLHLGTRPPTNSGVDGDVYSDFYSKHPRYLSAATTLAWRPVVDGLINLSLSTRSLPKLDGIDRATATIELMALPVAEWPWLAGVDWMSSYRPASSLREASFVRHDFGVSWGLWHWITPSERIRWFGRVDFFFDAPAAKLGSVIVAPTLGLELTSSGDRGLGDWSPQQAPFKEFQERGSARVRSSRAGDIDEPLGSASSGGMP